MKLRELVRKDNMYEVTVPVVVEKTSRTGVPYREVCNRIMLDGVDVDACDIDDSGHIVSSDSEGYILYRDYLNVYVLREGQSKHLGGDTYAYMRKGVLYLLSSRELTIEEELRKIGK